MIDELTLGVVSFRGSWVCSVGCSPSACCPATGTAGLFADINLLASAPADLVTRSQGATLLVPCRGVLSGYSAAELLGARCAPADANVELTGPGGDLRALLGVAAGLGEFHAVVRQVARQTICG